MNEQHNAHISLTKIVSDHEWKHAMVRQDYIAATKWSILGFRCLIELGLFNRATDYVIRED